MRRRRTLAVAQTAETFLMLTICREFLHGVHIGVAIVIPACATVWLLMMLGGVR